MHWSSNITPHIFKKIIIGSILEFGPIILFLISFSHLHIYKATMILMAATIISVWCTYTIQKRIPYLALYVALLTIIFGYITVSHHQPRFIQIRDTIYDVTCALTLLAGLMFNVLFLKLAFEDLLKMTTRAWTKITHSWIVLFLTIATANEYIRRTMSLENWFEFKGFVVIFTIIFGVITLYIFYEKDDKN